MIGTCCFSAKEVGQKLIDRDSRQVTLTPAGRHFLDYARKSTGDWQQLRSDLNAGPQALNGELSVFGSVTASYSLLATRHMLESGWKSQHCSCWSFHTSLLDTITLHS